MGILLSFLNKNFPKKGNYNDYKNEKQIPIKHNH